MSEYKRVLLISYMRSGTHVVRALLSKAMNLRIQPEIAEFNSQIIDDINFTFNADKDILAVTHIDSFEYSDRETIDRFNFIIKNRNIHVIFLDRKDFLDQLLSRIIFLNIAKGDTAKTPHEKFYIKKNWVESSYRQLYRLKYRNADRLGLHIDRKIYYEDVIENGLEFNGHLLRKEDIKSPNKSTIKNPDKKEIIKNYDNVLKWIDEYSKIYNEDWEPILRW